MEASAQSLDVVGVWRGGDGGRFVRGADEGEIRTIQADGLDVLVPHEDVKHVHFGEVALEIPFAPRMADMMLQKVRRRTLKRQQLAVQQHRGEAGHEMDFFEVFLRAPVEIRIAQTFHEPHARRAQDPVEPMVESAFLHERHPPCFNGSKKCDNMDNRHDAIFYLVSLFDICSKIPADFCKQKWFLFKKILAFCPSVPDLW